MSDFIFSDKIKNRKLLVCSFCFARISALIPSGALTGTCKRSGRLLIPNFNDLDPVDQELQQELRISCSSGCNT